MLLRVIAMGSKFSLALQAGSPIGWLALMISCGRLGRQVVEPAWNRIDAGAAALQAGAEASRSVDRPASGLVEVTPRALEGGLGVWRESSSLPRLKSSLLLRLPLHVVPPRGSVGSLHAWPYELSQLARPHRFLALMPQRCPGELWTEHGMGPSDQWHRVTCAADRLGLGCTTRR